MIWVFIVIGAALILSIAWFAITLVTTRLNATPTLAVFDIEEATNYIADNLPRRVQNHLSHDDVRLLLRWELTYFRERGVASFGGVDHAAERAARQGRSVVADEDDIVDELVTRAREEGLDVDAVDVVCVTDLANDYLVAIGAVGIEVDLDAVAPLDVADPAGELDAPEENR
ncbi:MAG: hypothetical protein AAF480_18240 [Actinomycetota bacterium]